MRSVVLLCLATTLAHAGAPDPTFACKPAAPRAKLRLSFRPGTSVADLAHWISATTCKNVVIDDGVARRALKATIISPSRYTPKQALALVIDAIEATGLAVTVKGDTVIIKPGPGMPRTCPDLAAAPPRPVPATPREQLDPALLDKIRRIDDTHHVVPRALVAKVLANPIGTAHGVRVVPAMKHGKQQGFKLYAIRPSSFVARIGFLNGDTIVAVNKRALTTLEDVLRVTRQLRGTKRLELEVVRRGKRVTLVLTIE